MADSDEESVSDSEEGYSSEATSGRDEYSSSSVSGESDASDSLKERWDSHGRASVSGKQLRNMNTNKAVLQEGEVVDPRLPIKIPRKPMVELTACSNVWYQGQVIKESANEVKIAYSVPNAQGRTKPRVEWLRKGSARIWRGSLKSHDWRHLGRGAWEPRAEPAKGSRSRKGGGGSGGGRNRKQQQKQRTRKDSRDTASNDDGLEVDTSEEQPKSRSNHRHHHHSHTQQQRHQGSRDGDAARDEDTGQRGGKDGGPSGGGRVDGGGPRDSGGGPRPGVERRGRQSAPPSGNRGADTKAAEDEAMSPRPGIAGGEGKAVFGADRGKLGAMEAAATTAAGTADGTENLQGVEGSRQRLVSSIAEGAHGRSNAEQGTGARTGAGAMGGPGTSGGVAPSEAAPQRRPQPPPPPEPEHGDTADEQASEHSPDDVAESPGGFLCDQFSTRCSPSDEDAGEGRAASGAGPAADPAYDPLARWFLAHYSQLQAAGTLALLPGGLYECGRLPAGFIIDPATALIVPNGLGRNSSAAGCQPGLGAAAGGANGGHNPAAHAPVGCSAAASPVPCAGACGGVSGSSLPPEPPQVLLAAVSAGAGAGPRQSGDGNGLPGSGRGATVAAGAGGGAGSAAVQSQRHLNKQTSGGSSNGVRERERDPRDGVVSVSPTGAGATAWGGKRPLAATEGPGGGHDVLTAGSGHVLKKLKRNVIISDSEDEEVEPPPPPAAPPPQPAAALQATEPSGAQPKGSGAGAAPSVRALPGATANASGGTGIGGAAAVKQEGQGGLRAAGSAPPPPPLPPHPPVGSSGPLGRSATVGGAAEGAFAASNAAPAGSGRVGGVGPMAQGGGGGSGGSAAAGGASAAAGETAPVPPGAGTGRAPVSGGGTSAGVVRSASAPSGSRSGSGPTAAGGGPAVGIGKDGLGVLKKELGAMPRPRAITTMDHDL